MRNERQVLRVTFFNQHSALSPQSFSSLALPVPALRPALDDHFRLRIELDAVPTLGVQVAKEALIPTAEREIGHRRGHADIDANVSSIRLVAELARRRPAAGEDAGHVAKGA